MASLTMEFDPGDVDAKQNLIKVHVKVNDSGFELLQGTRSLKTCEQVPCSNQLAEASIS